MMNEDIDSFRKVLNMIGMKILGSILVISACVLYGQYKKYQYKTYIRSLETLYQILYMLKGEIAYTKAPLDEVFLKLKHRCYAPYAFWFSFLAEEIQKRETMGFYAIWEKSIQKCLYSLNLKEEHKTLLNEFGQYLGQLDHATSLGTMQLFLERFYKIIQIENEHIATKNKLCDYLGIITGVFLVVLFV